MVNDSEVMIGTDQGNVLLFNINEREVKVRLPLVSRTRKEREKGVFAVSFEKQV